MIYCTPGLNFRHSRTFTFSKIFNAPKTIIMKPNYALLLVALLGMTQIKAQEPTFRLGLTFNTDQSMARAMGELVVDANTIYAVGAMNGTITPPPANGQILGFVNVAQLTLDCSNPRPVGDGVPSPPGKGMYSFAVTPSNNWMVGESYGPEKLFKYDPSSSSSWTPVNVTTETDKKLTYVRTLDNTNLLFIGDNQLCNNVAGDKIYTFNTTTETVTAVTPGLGAYNITNHVRQVDNKFYISGRTGLNIFDITSRTNTSISAPSLANFIDFIGHGDTMYTIGPGNVGQHGAGDCLYQKIGTGGWNLLCYTPIMSTASLHYLNGKVHILGAYDQVIAADSSVYFGSDLAYSEIENTITNAGIKTVHGMQEYIALPNGEFVGWSDGNVFTTSLVSGIEDINDNSLLQVYPNPARSFVTLNGLQAGQEVRITNNIGELIFNQKSLNNEMTINTQNMPDGIYFIQHSNIKQKLLITN